nr:hypothetical protein [Tanacetum cinerariifolium]
MILKESASWVCSKSTWGCWEGGEERFGYGKGVREVHMGTMAKDVKDHEKLGEVCWREAVRGRLQDASTDLMIYHMISFKGRSLRIRRKLKDGGEEDDPEEYEDDETEDGLVDYPMNGGDDGDDDDGDEDEDEEEEEEEQHLAPADSVIVIPTDELAEVERLLAIPTPSPSPLTSLSPPSTGERLARCTALAALPSPPLPPPLHMPPPIDRRDDIPETEMPPRKRLCLSTLGSSTLDAEARRQGIEVIGYGIRDTWVDTTETVPEIAPMTVGEASGTDGRDSPSDGRHETRDGRHVGRDASIARAAEES